MSHLIHETLDIITFWGTNLKTNLILTFTNVPIKAYLRLIAVVGGYLLLRPWLIKLGAKAQRKDHERVDKESAESNAKISPNALRGRVEIPEDSGEEDGGKGEVSWGKKARKRQRQVVKKLLEEQERKLMEEEDDEETRELEEFLGRFGATGKEVAEKVEVLGDVEVVEGL